MSKGIMIKSDGVNARIDELSSLIRRSEAVISAMRGNLADIVVGLGGADPFEMARDLRAISEFVGRIADEADRLSGMYGEVHRLENFLIYDRVYD